MNQFTRLPGPALESFPVIVFRLASGRLELLTGDREEVRRGLALAGWQEILAGGWKALVPEEFHPEVARLGVLQESEQVVTAEFPAYWMGTTLWVRVLAAAFADQDGERRIVGLAEDVTLLRHIAFACGDLHAPLPTKAEEEFRRELGHDLSGPLTSIIITCELLLEEECAPQVRQRVDAILSEAVRLDRILRDYSGN